MGSVYELEIDHDMFKKEEIMSWFNKHGIDGNKVFSPSTVIVDYVRRQIITEERLKPLHLVTVKGHRCLEDVKYFVIFIRRVHQHEAILKLPDIEEWRIKECQEKELTQQSSDLDFSIGTKEL